MLGLAKLLGEMCERVSVPNVLGYMATGIILGPMVLGSVSHDVPEIKLFAELGLIFLIFLTGFKEGNLSEMMNHKRSIVSVSALGYIFPFVVSFAIAMYFGWSIAAALILVLAVSATDIGVTVKTMLDMGRLNTPLGRTMLGVTILDGIVGLIVFTIAIAYIVAGNIGGFEFLKVIASILFFFLFFFIIRRVVPKIVQKVGFFSVEESQFAFAFVFILGLAITAELFGLHGIIGAFLAGMLLSRSSLADTDFISKLSTMSYAIFIPLFFVWTGLLVNVSKFTVFPLVIIVGVLSANFVGAYIGGFIGGMKTHDRFSMAFGMFPRGGINIAIASIGITLIDSAGNPIVNGELGSTLFSTVMLLIVVSVIVGSLLLKSSLKRGS